MQRAVHPRCHQPVFPNAPERIRNLALYQVADISEAAFALEIQVGNRARNRNVAGNSR